MPGPRNPGHSTDEAPDSDATARKPAAIDDPMCKRLRAATEHVRMKFIAA
jgi:hypothetical protein